MNTTELTARFAAPSVAGLAIPANDSVSTPPREATANDSAPIVKVLTLDELLLFPFPKQEPILAPWLTTQSLAMIHAWRGVGKTHVALNIAMAIARGGSFLNWHAPKARSVLYLASVEI